MDPFRIEGHFTLAAPDSEVASRIWEQLIEAAERLGLNFETSGLEAMAAEDVIEGSPLDRQLRG